MLSISLPGFNQFDPALFLSGSVTRRFGLGGGLLFVAALAATEGNEILKSFLAGGATPGDGVVRTTPSGLQYDLLVGAHWTVTRRVVVKTRYS